MNKAQWEQELDRVYWSLQNRFDGLARKLKQAENSPDVKRELSEINGDLSDFMCLLRDGYKGNRNIGGNNPLVGKHGRAGVMPDEYFPFGGIPPLDCEHEASSDVRFPWEQ